MPGGPLSPQVPGGYGDSRGLPVERLLREAEVMQIFAGSSQVQRLAISRALAR